MDLKSQYLKFLINIYVTIILAYQCYNFLITCSLQLQSVLAEVIQFVMSIKCSDQYVLKIEFWTLVPHLVGRLFGTIGISLIPCCHGNCNIAMNSI